MLRGALVLLSAGIVLLFASCGGSSSSGHTDPAAFARQLRGQEIPGFGTVKRASCSGTTGTIHCAVTGENGRTFSCTNATGTMNRTGIYCGRGSSASATNQQLVSQAAQAYADAAAAKDAVAACKVERFPDCVRVTKQDFASGDPVGKQLGTVSRVELRGDTARVDFSSGGFLIFSKQSDGWKLGAPQSQAAALGAPAPPQ